MAGMRTNPLGIVMWYGSARAGGSMMTIIIPGIGEAVVNIAQEALNNRALRVPREAFV